MRLPFSHEQFLDVFAAYNSTLWPCAVALWLLTAGALVYLFRHGAQGSRVLTAVLAAHWAWSGLAYHLAYFRSINPAAGLFAVVFAIQAVLLLWRGVFGVRLVFSSPRGVRGGVGVTLVGYAMAYPLVGILFGLVYPRLPTFGVPCPSTILTAGLLVLAPRHEARLLATIPLLWAGVGGSAAILLGIRADLALPLAGVALLVHLLAPERGMNER